MGRASADSKAPSSRTPTPPPCSASCRSWIARASSRSIEIGSLRAFLVTESLGEDAEDVPVFAHDLFRKRHLLRKARIVGGDPQPVRRLGDVDGVAGGHPQPCQ